MAVGLVDLPRVVAVPPSQIVIPVPTSQQLVCPGSILQLSDQAGQQAGVPSPVGTPSITAGAGGSGAEPGQATSSDAGTGGTSAAPTIISAAPGGTVSGGTDQAGSSGSQAQLLDVGSNDGGLAGLAAAACVPAAGDSWLVGGSTLVGRTTLLTLTNPTAVAASVTVELFGETGALAAPGTRGITVVPGGQRVLSIAGFRPDISAPVVHVVSVGGTVAATLQHSIIRGLKPGGIDLVGAVAAPALSTVIPGLVVGDLAAVQVLRSGGAPFADIDTVLRVFPPDVDGSAGTAQITVSLTPESDGGSAVAGSAVAAAPTTFTVEIPVGRVTDIPLQETGSGTYTVRIESTRPVVAAARSSSVSGDSVDVAWFVATPELRLQARVSAAEAPAPVLHLVNPTQQAATVRVMPEVGAPVVVAVPASGAASTPLQPGMSYTIEGFDRLFGAVSVGSPGRVAHYAVLPPGTGSTPITVYR